MKYMGSKARIAKDLIPIILKDRGDKPYLEPFAGGMNMVSEIPQGSGRYAADSNKYLISMWLALRDGWIPPKSVDREFYNECKNLKHEDYIVGYVGFNCSYSGKWFGGYAGVVNTAGGIRDYQAEAFKNVMLQKDKLKGVLMQHCSYSDIQIPKNAIIYCDPPYANTTGYKDKFDSAKFWDWVRYHSKYHEIYISEYSAPDDFECLWEKTLSSSLSANGDIGGNKSSVERLFRIRR